MKFELHCHSCYSQGTKIPTEGIPTPEEIVKRAKNIGLSGVAITDHKTTKAWDRAKREAKNQGILFIPGVELQTNQGHIIALGITEPVTNFMDIEETIEKIHEVDGIAIAAHPFDIKGDGVGNYAEKTDAIEVFNALNIDKISNLVALSKFKEYSKRKEMGFMVGSDAHTLSMIGSAITISDADDIDTLLKNIRKGKVTAQMRYTSMDEIIEWVRKRLQFSKNDVLRYVDTHYIMPKRWLYKKMLNNFLSTSNTPWKVLAGLSLRVVYFYSFLNTMRKL
jgi:predicted metal-dependent phosphoesterase TrpH